MTHAARKSIAAAAVLLILLMAAGAAAEEGDQWTLIRIVEPTCNDWGYTIYEKYLSPGTRENRDYVPALGHSFGDWITQTEPSCETAGTQTRACQRCGEEESRTLSPLGHTPGDLPAREPTCTEPGLTQGSACTVCGTVFTPQASIPALGHDWGTGLITALPSCTFQGVETFTCSRCGEVRKTAIPKLDHTPEALPRQEATCTQPGLTQGSVCSVCGEVLAEQAEIPALGHAWDAGRTVKEASCTQEGEILYTCERCGETDRQPLPTVPHTLVTEPGKEATCTESGMTEGQYCSVCGEVFAEQTEIAALDHLWDEGKVTLEPTCGADGVRTVTCQRCGEAYTEVLPATGEHRFGQWITYNPGDCETPDSQQRVCTVCGLQEYRDGLFGHHDWDGGAVTLEPTLLTSGTITYTCRINATHTKTETIPPLRSGSEISLRSMKNQGMPHNGGLTIDAQPQGGPVKTPVLSGWPLSVTVSGGTEPYTYQWYCEEKAPFGGALGTAIRQASDGLAAYLAQRSGTLAAAMAELSGGEAFPDQGSTEIFPRLLTLNSQPIEGATSAFCTARKGNCYYFCVIADANGSRVITEPVFVYDALYVAVQPQQINMYPEQTAVLRVKAGGGLEPYAYRWYMADADQLTAPRALPEGTEETLTVPRYLAAAYRYYCVITDAAGGEAQSEAVLVYYAEPLEFTAFSQDASVQAGESVKLQARVKGGMKPYACQWLLDGTPVDTAEDDSAGSILTATEPGEYTCTVTDALGEEVSRSVTVTQLP